MIRLDIWIWVYDKVRYMDMGIRIGLIYGYGNMIRLDIWIWKYELVR